MRVSISQKHPLRVLSLLLCGLWALVLVGCGANEKFAASPESGAATDAVAERAPAEGEAAMAPAAQNKSAGAVGAQPVGSGVSAIARKIIYTAEVSLVVENLTEGQNKLLALVSKHGGFVAGSNIGGATGNPRSGSWKARLPVGNFGNFMTAVETIGEVQTIHSDSQDVSEEYYDLQARIANKQVEEKRLIEHLKDTTAKLDDILKVEKEISRVRGEIEQMQGRIRVLSNLTELATVTVTINEIKDYKPPAPPTFGTQITRTFDESFKGVVNFGKGIVLAAVALAPWLVVFLIFGVPLWIMARRRLHLRSPKLQPGTPTPEP